MANAAHSSATVYSLLMQAVFTDRTSLSRLMYFHNNFYKAEATLPCLYTHMHVDGSLARISSSWSVRQKSCDVYRGLLDFITACSQN